MTHNKIREFIELLNNGLSKEDAMEQSGVSEGTARIQFSKWNKANKPAKTPQKENLIEDTEEEIDEDISLDEEI